ncbi:tRNA dihydrouridine synthase DusB [Rhodobacterales bacterium 52_120_T64]|nr:tRNA dihydrouridine synthase DusB [Rhodobacterales bacterium 52_120_T64]
MPVTVGNLTLDPPVFLAPLAGITDLPFRKAVLRFGAGLVVSEMVASQEMVQAKPSTRARAELGFGNDRTSVQIAGREAYWMAECAKLVADRGARIVDINMGCPAKKVTTGYSGSALMKDPDHALTLIDAVVGAVEVPVTLKMRLGWDDDCLNAADIAKRAEEAGVQMITIHGRTRCQFYKGAADWGAISAVKAAVNIPVIANGDITDSHSAIQALKLSKSDGVMVGRGAQGQPWVLAQIAAEVSGKTYTRVPQGSDLADVILTHYEDMIRFYGPELGVRNARKHLTWYLELLEGGMELRNLIIRERDANVVMRHLIDGLKNCGPLIEAAA